MFGFSFGEIIVISVVALLVLGPERIPIVARSLGRALAELRRSLDEVKNEFSLGDFNKNDPFNLTRPNQPRLPSQTGLRAEPLKHEIPPVVDNASHDPNYHFDAEVHADTVKSEVTPLESESHNETIDPKEKA